MSSFLICRAGLRTRAALAGDGEKIRDSSVSILISVLWGDCFMGVLGVESLFRFRVEGIASSMSTGSSVGSFVSFKELVIEEWVLRRVERVALRNFVVSWDILEVRMMKWELYSFGAAEVAGEGKSWLEDVG